MRNLFKLVGVVVLGFAPSTIFGATGLKAPDLTVGCDLQTFVSVKLPAPAPSEGVQLTVTSEDPKKALISRSVDKAGSASITLMVKGGSNSSPEFFVQGLTDSGSVAYTVTAPGMEAAKGKITLAPSSIAILGPSKQSSFQTTPRGSTVRFTLVSALLDSSLKVLDEQQIAGGSTVTVRIESSHPEVGTLGRSVLTLNGGESIAFTTFTPAAEGKTTFSLLLPGGFRTSANLSSVVASVQKPGIAVADDLTIGKDLQMPGIICLGDPAGPEGLTLTLTSNDPGKLVLSTAADKLGDGTITIHVPPGDATARYYMQSLSDSGTVEYEATAPGYRSRTGHTTLAPSGVIVGYSHYGPPDEAAVLRRMGDREERSFYTSIEDSKKSPVRLMVWSAYLDDGLAADITVQSLRPGVSVTVNLTSSNPSIGTVESPVTIPSGSNHGLSLFTPLSMGQSIITIDTPVGFSRPKNAVYVPANVMK
jgi:hypothetical protein